MFISIIILILFFLSPTIQPGSLDFSLDSKFRSQTDDSFLGSPFTMSSFRHKINFYPVTQTVHHLICSLHTLLHHLHQFSNTPIHHRMSSHIINSSIRVHIPFVNCPKFTLYFPIFKMIRK